MEWDPSASDTPTDSDRRTVFSVSTLNRAARDMLESGFPAVWVEGEISNLARPASGHIYFSLKDEQAQIRCAMFKGRNRLVQFDVSNGQKALARGRLSIYDARGDYQLIVERMEAAGEGALRQAFEALKRQLEKEGLFAAEHKKPIPEMPNRIGIVTSPTGAAVRDVLKVLRRRFSATPAIVYPVPVQGNKAAGAISTMLDVVARRNECDVLILARGGGSLEDLWAFNEEQLARAIYACPIPIICGVGHEIDVTIADFVADLRAPTPSGAAELVVPDQDEFLRRLKQQAKSLRASLGRRLGDSAKTLKHLSKRLAQQHPGRRTTQQIQRLDDLERRLNSALTLRLRNLDARLSNARHRLRESSPDRDLPRWRSNVDEATRRLRVAATGYLNTLKNRLLSASRALDTVSPLATLDRGYAIVTSVEPEKKSVRVVREAASLAPGDRVRAQLSKGSIEAEVTKVEEKN